MAVRCTASAIMHDAEPFFSLNLSIYFIALTEFPSLLVA
jgi:hypothetical protein